MQNKQREVAQLEEKEVKKDIVNRLRTIKGHIQGIEKMIEEDKECEDILLQITAVKSSVDRVGQLIIENHSKECLLKDNISSDEIDKVLKTILKFMK
ncbi:metal-sensitive transcriptional regulator [Alkaliphilus metalliredigens]|uniref:metal-sensitive transcriptional regulator n=1 Tax=Alkaliphilus metalliredigens TaxID=208226 RepID=UPI001F6036B5|nr:metal-sensitive transcriptional regulator [Alkaliphilus metalliredigens]